MDQLPAYVYLVFGATAIVTLVMLYRAAHYSKIVLSVAGLWIALQTMVSATGFYTITNTLPPRFALLLFPPVVLLIVICCTKRGRQFMDGMDARVLTLLHVVRIPVELSLYWLYLHKAVPGLITFEGRNFDVLSGLTAPLVYYFGYVRNMIGRKVLIAWNVVCLLLLANVVVTAIHSAPLPFQQFAFEQPNIAMLYFPFIWLPCFIVPAVLFAHMVCLRQLLRVVPGTDQR